MLISDSVNKQMFDILKRMILEQQIKAGERIDCKAIANKYNTSVMPVRNALQQLTVQGLVVTKQRVGYYVRKFSEKDLIEINDTRAMYEVYCLNKYFSRIDKTNIRNLYNHFADTEYDDLSKMIPLDQELHKTMVTISENSFLIKQYEDMNCLFSLGNYTGNAYAEVAKKEHMDILHYILEESKVKAVEALVYHLNRVEEEIKFFHLNSADSK